MNRIFRRVVQRLGKYENYYKTTSFKFNNGYIVEINEENFQKELLQSPIPVLVDIYADWSLDSQQLSGILEKKIKEKNGNIKLVRINLDKQPEIAQQFQVENVPSTFGLIGNQMVSKHVGKMGEIEVEKFIQNILSMIKGGEEEEEEEKKENYIEQAKELFKRGDMNGALSIYEHVISNEELKEYHQKGYIGILKCLLTKNEIEESDKIYKIIKENYKEFDKEDKLILDMFEINKIANITIPVQELIQNIQNNPNDLNSLFQYSAYLFLNVPNQKEKSMELLLKIIKKDLKWENQKAKILLTKYFDVLGEDELVKKYRKKLATALF